VKKRSFVLLLAGVMTFSGPISAVAAENAPVSGDDEDIVIVDDAANESSDEEDEILVEDEDASNAASSGEETEIDAQDPASGYILKYFDFEGVDDFDSVMEGDGEAGYDVIQDKYPSSYTTSRLPELRNQTPYGTCWAHSAIDLAEISLLKKGLVLTTDLSELHLAYFSYNSVVDPLGGTKGDDTKLNPDFGESFMDYGGNSELALHTMARWEGAADEDLVPYSSAETAIKSGLADNLAHKDKAHLTNFYKEHYKVDGKLNLDAIKEMITRYGAVSISYKHNSSAYASYYNCYYNPGTLKGEGHGVTIVGWDDHFSRQNFKDVPEGNGAWLVRNSWYNSRSNPKYSLYGYFWMSYYESTISDTVYAAEFELAPAYSHNYQYDGGSINSSFSSKKFGNIFTAAGKTGAEVLRAVSFETPESNLEYKISIYKDLRLHLALGPTVGDLVATVTGKTDYAGYYTVKLPEPVYMPNGTTFGVVIECQDSSKTFKLASETEVNMTGCKYGANSEEVQSFLMVNGIWRDFKTYYIGCNGNFRIKAFTDDTAYVNPTSIVFDQKVYDMKGVAQYEPKVTVGPKDATDKRYTLSSSNPDVVDIYHDIYIIPKKAGTATITATTKVGNIKATATVNVIPTFKLNIVGEKNLVKGNEYTYKVEFDPADTKETVEFSSSDTKVITIDKNTGRAKAVGVGNAEIIATAGGVTARYKVSVSPATVTVAYKVENDNTVSLIWQNTGADYYSVEDNGTVLATNIHADSTGACIFTDKRYTGKPNSQIFAINYKVVAVEKGLKSTTQATVYLNKIYSITYVLNGGQNDPANPSTYMTSSPDIVFKDATKTGCDFEGWYRSSSYREKVTTIKKGSSGNVTLYAKWAPHKYTVAFNGNGGSGSMASMTKLECGQTYNLKANCFVKKGYAFRNWNTKKDGSGQAYGNGAAIKDLSTVNGRTVTLYAQWDVDKSQIAYTIKFNGNKATGSMKPLKKCLYYNTYQLTANKFKKKGYDFVGWNTKQDGTGISFADGASVKQLGSKMGETVTLYAQWKMNTYSITYVLDGGTNASENPVTYNVTTKTIKLQKLVREGYTFGGWFKQYDGSKFTKKASQISKGSAGDITLYAKWTMNKYNIAFNGNKAKGKMAKLTKCEYFTKYTLPENQFVKKGYVFTGWNTKKDGTGIAIKDKADIYKPSFVIKNGQTITLYAQWKAQQ
jgi:uncharacterized repeat protein (TIGR02543 family)